MITSQDFLADLVLILIPILEDRYKELYKKDIILENEDNKSFLYGEIMAYYDVLTIIKSQCDLFEIQIPTLNNISLDKYLFPPK